MGAADQIPKQIPILGGQWTIMRLRPRQRRFVEEYLVDLNGTQAAIRAGYSEKTAAVIARENLRKPLIEMAIHEELDRRTKESWMSRDRLLLEVARLAYADVRQLYDENGRLRPVAELEDDIAAAVAAIDVSVGPSFDVTKKVRLCDKGAAQERLARLLGFIIERKELSGPGGKPLQVENLSEEDLDARIAAVEEEIRGMRSDGKTSEPV